MCEIGKPFHHSQDWQNWNSLDNSIKLFDSLMLHRVLGNLVPRELKTIDFRQYLETKNGLASTYTFIYA